MSQHEGEAGLQAGISQPIPAEHALAADRQIVAIRFNELEKESEVIVPNVGVNELFTGRIHEADVHLTCMQIDSAVEFGGGDIILHDVRR